MPPVGFEPTISAGERPKTYALDRAATVTGYSGKVVREFKRIWKRQNWHASIMPKGNVRNPKSSYGKTSFKAAEYRNQTVEGEDDYGG